MYCMEFFDDGKLCDLMKIRNEASVAWKIIETRRRIGITIWFE